MDKIPLFMKRSRFVEEDSSTPCIFLLSKESIRKYRTVYLSIDCLVMILLVLIYSRIVYTLWFKQSDNALLTNQVGPFALYKGVLDSAFLIPGTELRIPIGSGIPYSLSWIDSKAHVNKFQKQKNFLDFRICIPLHRAKTPIRTNHSFEDYS